MNEEFEKRLIQVAESRISQRGVRPNPVISNFVAEVVREGIRNMSPSELNDPLKTQLAERNLAKLVDSVISKTLNEGLQTRTFSEARRGICPLWPFC
jgi:hypothetical protein